MKYSLFTTAILVLCTTRTEAQTPANDPHWQLVWEDNFNTLDNAKWTVANYFDHYGEPQVYRTENVSVSGGQLTLTTKKESCSCPPIFLQDWACTKQLYSGQPYAYTSGWIESKQAFNTQYGYIESRMQLPDGFGLWPAFWTFKGEGVDNFSNYAEIDIFEMLGNMTNMDFTTNIHWNYPDDNAYMQYSQIPYFNFTDWHIYAIEWSPDRIIWYVDGKPIRQLRNHYITDPVRLIINTAIRPEFLPTTSTTAFPSYFRVDYVRVYDIKADCNTTINTCSYNFATHDNKLKKEIIIGGGSCVNALPSNANVTLRATDGVLISGDFTVPNGAQLYIDASGCH